MPVKGGKDLTKELERALGALSRLHVVVGIPAEAGSHEGSSVTNADLGYIHEYGAPEANIPPRPFLVPGMERIREQISDELTRGAGRAILAVVKTGSASAGIDEATKALERIGLIAQSSVQNVITEGIAPPLAERTVYARMHRKKNRRRSGAMTPLIDTGALRQSITYIVKRRDA